MKVCIDCGEDETKVKFYEKPVKMGGHTYRIKTPRCSRCHNRRRAEQLAGRIPVAPPSPPRTWEGSEERTCSKCGLSKPVRSGYGWVRSPSGRRYPRAKCKDCVRRASSLTAEETRGLFAAQRLDLKSRDLSLYLWGSARRRAVQNDIPFSISPADVMVPEKCPVLGLLLQPHEGRPSDSSPTVDRLIPELGYVKGNVSVVSFRANMLKSDGTVEELEAIVRWMRSRSA